MSRADRHKEAARKVEERLREEGRAFDADQIRHLRLSLSACQTTLSQVHKQLGEALTALRSEREKALREAVPNFLGIDYGADDETCVVVIKTHSDGAMEVIDMKHGDEARAILRALEGGGE